MIEFQKMSIFNFIIYGTVSIVSKIFVYIFKSLTYQGCVYLTNNSTKSNIAI